MYDRLVKLYTRGSHVDKGLVNAIKSEMAYWTEILRRVIAAILHSAGRGLVFHGSNEVALAS